MMKKKLLIGLIFSLFYVSGEAQDEAQSYFERTLRGIETKAPEGRFSIKQLDTRRADIWTAWRAANHTVAAPGLPPLDSLGAARTGVWPIPASLEPNAAMPFYYGYKGAKPADGYPLFLYLHGSGNKESEWATGLVLAKRFADAPSAYFIPQIPQEGEWFRWWQKGKQYAWEHLLRQLMLQDYINPNRLYVFGISEGGYGSQRLASFYADYWAAAGPMAGGEPLKNAPAENLCNIPFSLRTGAEDTGFYRHILTRYTAEALDSLENLYPAGYRHRVALIPGYGHGIDYAPTTPWLSHFTRNPWPKHFIWEDFEMDGVHRTGFYNLWVQERPDSLLRTRYDVDIRDNEVRIAVENVHYQTLERDPVYGIELKFARTYEMANKGRFVVFLNEELVDLQRSVTVIVNGQQMFKGKVRLDERHLAESTALFGDPERMYPAAVEVELGTKP